MATSKPKKLTPAQIEENHNLLSKADIAEMLNISSQLLSNKATRAAEKGEDFPEPTYSNQSGTVTLYTIEDAKLVYEYVTRAERERLEKAQAAFAKFGVQMSDGTPVEEPTLDLPEDKAPAAPAKEEPKVEAKAPEKAAEKPAAKSEAKPVTVADAKAPEVKADAAKAELDRKAAEQARLDKNESRRITATDNKSGVAPKTPAKVGNGSSFGAGTPVKK